MTELRQFTTAENHPEMLQAIEALYAACHPTWPKRPSAWWWTHPTLLLCEDTGLLVGMTSMAFTPPPAPTLARLSPTAEVCWGHGVEVHPGAQGRGYGWLLAEARLDLARSLGVGFFLGMTNAENKPMRHILERQGFRIAATLPGAYPHDPPPGTGLLYTGAIPDRSA